MSPGCSIRRQSRAGRPELVPAADWLKVRILLPSRPSLHHPGDVSSHRMTLDMRRGVLLSEARHPKRRAVGMRLRTLRLVSLGERAVGLQLIQIEIEDGVVEMTLKPSFEGVELGLDAERLDTRSWPLAHPAFGQAPRHGDRVVAADRWPRTAADASAR